MSTPVPVSLYAISAWWEISYPVKFGVARYPLRRVRELQTANPHTLFLLASVEIVGSPAGLAERAVHDEFATSRLAGEWFTRNDHLMSFCRWMTLSKFVRLVDVTEALKLSARLSYMRKA